MFASHHSKSTYKNLNPSRLEHSTTSSTWTTSHKVASNFNKLHPRLDRKFRVSTRRLVRMDPTRHNPRCRDRGLSSSTAFDPPHRKATRQALQRRMQCRSHHPVMASLSHHDAAERDLALVYPSTLWAISLANSETGALPEAISTCMGIARVFAPRTPETKSFLWRTIEAEYRRFVTDVSAQIVSTLQVVLC